MSRASANAAYIAWLNGTSDLLSADDAAIVRSEVGWLAYLAGYLAAEQRAKQPAAAAEDDR